MTEQPKTLEEAAAYFRVSRRFFQGFIAEFPFYREIGRRKLFFADDIWHLTEALKRPCPSSSSRRAKANRPTTQSEAPTSDATLTELDASFRGNELAGEVEEACNIIKKLERERLGIPGSRTSLDRLAEELADVVICADLIGMHYGIDLRSAVARKFNAKSMEMGFGTLLSEEFVL
jgi:hypothetical protein